MVLQVFNDIRNNLLMFGTWKYNQIYEQKKPWYILSNSSKFRILWNIISIIILIYTATVMPFWISFVEEDGIVAWSLTIDTMIDVLFVLDIFVTFLSSYEDKDGI